MSFIRVEDQETKEGYLCIQCAKKRGAVEDKSVASHIGECIYCGGMLNVCHTRDWNWPNKSDI